jgi:hypothetical protein
LLVLGVLMAGELSAAVAAEREVRVFNILVDGRKVGQYQMEVTRQDNGTLAMTGSAKARVSLVVYTVTYTYDGTEVWKDGRLQSFRSTCNDNGKHYQVGAAAEGNGLRVRVIEGNRRPGVERLTRADVWTTSYWHLPPAGYRNQAVPLLDADTGRDIAGQLRYLGAEQVSVAGQKLACTHYRVTGGPSPVDLWYDGQERLVRQDYMEEGHRTILELANIQR